MTVHHPRSRTSSPSVVRTFIAVELDEAMREALAAVQDDLRAAAPHRSVRWVRPTSIHLTLKFLGDTPVARLEEIKRALDAAAAEVASFSFTVEELGFCPHGEGGVKSKLHCNKNRTHRRQHAGGPVYAPGIGNGGGIAAADEKQPCRQRRTHHDAQRRKGIDIDQRLNLVGHATFEFLASLGGQHTVQTQLV